MVWKEKLWQEQLDSQTKAETLWFASKAPTKAKTPSDMPPQHLHTKGRGVGLLSSHGSLGRKGAP